VAVVRSGIHPCSKRISSRSLSASGRFRVSNDLDGRSCDSALRLSNPFDRVATEAIMEWLTRLIQDFLVRWGLLGESAGMPLPGETILMYSSFVAKKTHRLDLVPIILAGIAAAIVGDNLGYFAGKHLGSPLLRWLNRKLHLGDDIAAAAELIRSHGGATVFWARFVVGLRTVAGPVAGAQTMEWKKSLLFNALGATTCVATTSVVAFSSPTGSTRWPASLRRSRGSFRPRSLPSDTSFGGEKQNSSPMLHP